MKNCIILIPVYNPTQNFVSLINKIKDNKLNLIVVNDGSNKEYDYVFDKIKDKCILLTNKENMGKGFALKVGFKYIKENYKDAIIVTMDADGQHLIEDAIKLYEFSKTHKDYLVLGSRNLGRKIPIRSRIGNTITRKVFYKVTKVKVKDTQTGLRSFHTSLLELLLSIDGNRYEYEMNMLLTIANKKIPIKEIGIKTIYLDNNSSSHFNTIKDSYRIYKEILSFNKKISSK